MEARSTKPVGLSRARRGLAPPSRSLRASILTGRDARLRNQRVTEAQPTGCPDNLTRGFDILAPDLRPSNLIALTGATGILILRPMFARFSFLIALPCLLLAGCVGPTSQSQAKGGKPIRALLITGGCYHNYQFQSDAMTNAIGKVANVEWTILREECTGSTKKEIALYDDPNWARPFDIIIHNECFADTDNPDYVRKITAAHKAGKPAMVIHCAMHTYRAAKFDDWREFLGVTSRYHEELTTYPVRAVVKDHPVMKGFPDSWTTPSDELYVIEKVWPGTQGLALGKSARNAKEYPVIWVNEYHGTRVFGTTFGHSDATFRDPVYLNLLANGFLWASGRTK